MNQTTQCHYLPWDSDFFGVRIGHIQSGHLRDSDITAIQDWARAEAIACLYFLTNADDLASVRTAEQAGMNLVDIRLTYQRELGPLDEPPADDEQVHFRDGRPEDADILRTVARGAYQQSRFFADPNFASERATQLYDHWLTQSLNGAYDDAVSIAELGGKPVAYVSYRYTRQDAPASIGLVGVAAEARQRSLGRRVLEHAQARLRASGADTLTVVTQGRNIAAQRLYQRAGYLITHTELRYHWWLHNAVRS